MKKSLLLLLTVLVITACEQGPSQEDFNALVAENEKLKHELEALKQKIPDFDDYIGLWHSSTKKNPWSGDISDSVLEIKKNGNTYLAIKDPHEENPDSMALSISGEQLVVKTGGGEVVFSLLGDGNNSLQVRGDTYQRTDAGSISKLKTDIKAAKEACADLEKKFYVLKKERDKKMGELYWSSKDNQEEQLKLSREWGAVQRDFQEQANKIKGCRF